MRAWKSGIVIMLLVSLILAGCTGSKNDGQGNASPSPSPSASTNTNSPAPPAAEKLTLKWFVNGSNNYALPAKDKDFIKKTIDEKFNVDQRCRNGLEIQK